jgi:hypothetical protein
MLKESDEIPVRAVAVVIRHDAYPVPLKEFATLITGRIRRDPADWLQDTRTLLRCFKYRSNVAVRQRMPDYYDAIHLEY